MEGYGEWDQWKIDFLIENWDKYSDKYLKEYLDVTNASFYKYKRELNCKHFRWTKEKIELLKIYYPNTEWEELFKILGVNNKNQIFTKASELKISRDIYNNCHRTKEEINYITDHYLTQTPTEMAQHLKRNVDFVCRIMKEKGYSPLLPAGRLRLEDELLFIEVYPKYTNKYLSQKFFPYLDSHQMRTQAKRLGLVKNKEKGAKQYDKEDILEKLQKAIEKIGRVPMITELQECGLPSDKTFKRYFGSYTEACNIIGVKRPCYQHLIMGQDGGYTDKQGNVCYSLSEVDISNFLIDNNFYFQKEPYYKEIIPVEECGEKRFDWKVGSKYIEFFGLGKYKNYDQKTVAKLNLIKKYNIPCLVLFPEDMKKSNIWQNKILKFLK